MNQLENVEITARVGARIGKAREDKGMSQSELAERVNASLPQIMKYEHGEQDMAIARLFDIAAVLGLPVSELLQE
jgi:transcriptional regulator with XRE-family HTH domain